MNKLNLLHSLVLLFFGFLVKSQGNDSTLLVASFKAGFGTQLKWVPASLNQFELGMNNGYEIYRAPVFREGDEIRSGSFMQLNKKPVLPWTRDIIDAQSEIDVQFDMVKGYLEFPDYMENRAQPTNLKEAVEADEELEYFSFFSTLTIFQKNEYAQALGYYYLDSSAVVNQEYIYKVEMKNHETYLCYTLVNTGREQFKAQIPNFKAKIETETVRLKWFNNQNKDYIGYNIYRSNKAKGSFEKINDLLYMSSGGAAASDENYSYYRDSIAEYGKTYYYKLRGVNPFGEEGPETQVEKVTTFRLLTLGINLNDAEDYGKEGIRLSWKYNELDKESIEYLDLYHSEHSSGPFEKINPNPISTKQTEYLDKSQRWHSNYYMAYAHGLGGDSLGTMVKMFLLEDSISPEMPEFIDITCDTNGIVTATWKNNTERDLEGYRLYRTYDRSTQPERLHYSALTDTVFVDTLNLKEGYNKVFYRLHAIDQMYNPSLPTEYFHVVLPDKIPPSSGYFTSYEITFEGIELTWQKPSDLDLKSLTLYRKAERDFGYYPHLVLMGENLMMMRTIDTLVEANRQYDYYLQAQDHSGLLSDNSQHLNLTMMDNSTMPSVENLAALVSKENAAIKLHWELKANAVGYQLLRAENNKSLEKYDYVSGNVREYYDQYISPNTRYTYQLVADLESGFTSGPSKKLKVKY